MQNEGYVDDGACAGEQGCCKLGITNLGIQGFQIIFVLLFHICVLSTYYYYVMLDYVSF